MQLSSHLFERIVRLNPTGTAELLAWAEAGKGTAPAAGDGETNAEAAAATTAEVAKSPNNKPADNKPAEAKPADAAPPAVRRGSERRQVPRIPLPGERARVCVASAGETSVDCDGVWESVMLQDISVQGISFLSSSWIGHGDTVLLSLRDHLGNTIHLRCIVARCDRGGMGGVSYLIAALFDAVLSDPGAAAVTTPAPEVAEALASMDYPSCSLENPPPRWQRTLWRLRHRVIETVRFFREPDDYSTVRIGRFRRRSAAH